jgi:N-acetyl-gamma-glutamyl-phosphate reductase
MKIRVGILGATGYTGLELLRMLKNHPQVKITYLSSNNFSGQSMKDIYPFAEIDILLSKIDVKEIKANCDVVFTALPAGISYDIVKSLRDENLKIIDLGADLRFDDPSLYEKWYGRTLQDYGLIKRVYGLPELYRSEIKESRFIGNPGCYPTSILLATAPILKRKLLVNGEIIVDSKSGVSGAGKKEELAYSFCEIDGSLKPYSVINHKHVPEIQEQMKKIYHSEVTVIFAPHLVPMVRGILSTIYLKTRLSADELYELYSEFYRDEYFVHVLRPAIYPSTKWSYGSNHVFISMKKDERTDTAVLISVLDNLVKGASGQAIQNMNILFSLREDTGLTFTVYP